MYVLADSMFRKQWIGKKKTGTGEGEPNGRYGEVYAARRTRTLQTHPDWTDSHRHKDALRVMFKRFIADLWERWIDLSNEVGQHILDAQYSDADLAA